MRKFLTWTLIAVVGFIAYTLGAKAGRSRYREIRATVDAVWNDPKIKKARKRATKQAEKAADAAAKRLTKKIGH